MLRRLRKLRVWYGDGGGREWTDIDYSKPKITTSVEDGDSIVLSADFHTVTLNSKGEAPETGRCKVASMKEAPKRWFAPELKQPWEKN